MKTKEQLEARLAELKAIRDSLLADFHKANGAVLAYEEVLTEEESDAAS